MQYRQPRLGDIVDDYCPRERRLTNHAVVAMVGPDIKQTRCTTCDTEHEYKHAKVPASRKKKDGAPALFKQVLAAAQPENMRNSLPLEDETPAEPSAHADEPDAQNEAAAPAENVEPMAASAEDGGDQVAGDEAASEEADEGPVHRRLIRATLPRPEGGQVQPRPLPQFTVRQPGRFGNNNNSRGGRPGGGGGRTRAAGPRGNFGRNATRDNFSARPSGSGQHHGLQRSRPAHRGGRPAHQGKKSK